MTLLSMELVVPPKQTIILDRTVSLKFFVSTMHEKKNASYINSKEAIAKMSERCKFHEPILFIKTSTVEDESELTTVAMSAREENTWLCIVPPNTPSDISFNSCNLLSE